MKIFKTLSLSSAILCVLFVSGCAPGLGTTLNVRDIPVSESAGSNLIGLRVKAGPFEDMRQSFAIAKVEGRDVRPEGDIGLSVQQALERQLKAQGARLSIFNAPLIKGTIKEWYIKVVPEFPSSRAYAKAGITVDLLDAGGKKLMTGTYRGIMEAENPILSEEKISGILGSAMQQAILHMLNDQKFVRRLRDASAAAGPGPADEVEENTRPPLPADVQEESRPPLPADVPEEYRPPLSADIDQEPPSQPEPEEPSTRRAPVEEEPPNLGNMLDNSRY